MKRIIYTMVFLCSFCFMQAQDVMKVKKVDGSIIEYNVSDIDEVFFDSVGTAPGIPGCLTCPDNHHPHAIDLGLPSGTKWCCCNVGASCPEEYGGYYAWGETSEKSVYDDDTYAFYDSSTDSWVNIGSDISGTQYDVAHVRMGAPWRMPSFEQLKEFYERCMQKFTQQNGVSGFLVIGPNGGQVFLPAAGLRSDGDLDEEGWRGYYWSGSLSPYGDYAAYDLRFFGSADWSCAGNNRVLGRSVRAVCP